MKKLFAVLIALALVLSMSAVAFATAADPDPTYTITIDNETSGHTYQAYQIFKGIIEETEDGNELSNIVWGDGIKNGAGLLAALKENDAFGEDDDNAFAACNNAADVAQVLAGQTSDSAFVKAFAKAVAGNLKQSYTSVYSSTNKNYTIEDLDGGYYLIKDMDNQGILDDKQDAYTSYMLQVIADVKVEPKSDVPEVQKKVKDINDSDETPALSDWQDSADHDIDDTIPYQIKGTLPENFADYKEYYVKFNDTMCKGLTFGEITSVTVGDTELDDEDYTLTMTTDGFTVEIDDVKAFDGVTADDEIVIEYTCVLNDQAKFGSEGNPNTVNMQFSNNPNYEGSGTPGSEDDHGPTGKTPDDTVIVFTYKTIVNKVDAQGNALEGAAFALYKLAASDDDAETEGENKGYVLVKAFEVAEGQTTFEFKGLDDGTYRLVETTVPDGYNGIEAVTFTVTAAHDILSDDPQLTELVVGDVLSGTVTYEGTFASVPSETTDDETTYSGEIVANVVNNSGAVLPSTGGIGTTIFYIIGATLVVGAALILFARKRMSATAA